MEELYENPLTKKGRRPECDLLLPAHQARLLEQARGRDATHWLIAFPCTSWCSWQKLNGGTRTWDQPQGQPGGPQREQEGKELCEFSAKLFTTAANAGDVPVAENLAPDALYPSAWAMPCWQKAFAAQGCDHRAVGAM